MNQEYYIQNPRDILARPKKNHLTLSRTPKKENRTRININIINIRRQLRCIPIRHPRRTHRIKIIHIQILRRGGIIHENRALTGRRRASRRAARAVMIEKRIQSRAVDEDVRRGSDAQAPCERAVGGGAGGTSNVEIGVVEGGVHGEGIIRRRVGLVVWRFGLDLAHEDVLGAGELVLVARVMFYGCTY